MVTANITSLTRNGLADFVAQRVSAVIIAAYTLCVLSFFLCNSELDYRTLVHFFGGPVMRWFSQLTLLAIVAHAWIGIWTVLTDYLRPHYFGRAETPVRIVAQALCALITLTYLAWGTEIIWSA